MPIFLLRHHGTDVRLSEDGTLLLGRSEECGICLSDTGVSRRHASLRVAPEGVWIEDLGSQNGVFVNGRKLDGPFCLRSGDWFRIGNNEFALRVVWDSGDAAAFAAPSAKVLDDEFADQRTAADVSVVPAARPRLTTQSIALDEVDPLGSIRQSCRGALQDTGLSLLDRLTGAFHLVQALIDMRADADACLLFGEALDMLRQHEARGLLPPLVAARAQAFLGRWWVDLALDPDWQARAAALRAAERI